MFFHTRMSDLGGNAGLVAVKRLLTYPVSTCAAERSFSMHEEA